MLIACFHETRSRFPPNEHMFTVETCEDCTSLTQVLLNYPLPIIAVSLMFTCSDDASSPQKVLRLSSQFTRSIGAIN